jgi:sugar phosphate isomerase/epimerase
MNSDRRTFLGAVAGVTAAGLAGETVARGDSNGSADSGKAGGGFTYCLNTSTIRGQNIGIVEEVRVAAEAGYDGIEPWIRTIRQYVEEGGSLSDLRKRIADAGLTVESAIGFAQWIVDDEEKRKQGLDEARRDMELLAEIGGKRIAAPPTGAQNGPKLDLFDIADRYRALLEVGQATGVIPQLEVWGFSSNLSRLGESVAVCVEASHPQACLLPDVYHIFKGGSDFGGLALLHDEAIQVFHLNDYPAEPARAEMNDSHRVYPGDGVAPLSDILNMIGGNGRSVALSLELFNREYWEQDASVVAKTGLEKMKAAVAAI